MPTDLNSRRKVRSREQSSRRYSRDKIRKKARRRKLRKQSRVYHKKINKRKYYGVKKHIKQYKDIIQNSLDYDRIFSIMDRMSESASESFIDDLISQVGTKELMSAKLMMQVGDMMEEVFNKGSKRVFTTKGEKLDVPEITNTAALGELMKDQDKYFKNLTKDAKDTIHNTLSKGVKKGKSIPDMRDNLQDNLDSLTKNRANTIARSEVIKASSRGSQTAMKEAGIERVIWIATNDERTCETCADLHNSVWDREEAPMPVEDSHCNCRCTLIADV